MNKLGFAIKLVSEGAGNVIECNKGQWTNKVVDIREYLKLFNGLQGTDNIVSFMSFDKEGCFITLLRAISGRVGDSLSGWIYIPNTIEISGTEVENVYKFVKNILSQSNLNDCKNDILSFFSKEYPNKAYAVYYTPTSGDVYGVRFIGYYNLPEIFDSNRYQLYYSKYKAIFLLEQNNEVSIADEYKMKFEDLSTLPIEQTCLLKAPTSHELLSLGRGVKLIFPNNVEFRESIPRKRGEIVQLYAVRVGFEPLKLPAFEIESDIQSIPEISQLQGVWKKKISSSMFKVYNSKNEPIGKGVSITVNGQDVTYKEILLLEDDCRNALVKVTATDFNSNESIEDLLRGDIQIKLRRKEKTFQSKIEMANGQEAVITLESKDIESSQNSPLKGYDFDNNSHGEKCLRMSSEFIWKQRLYGFLAALVVGLTFVVYQASDSWLHTHHFKFGLPPWERDRVEVKDTTATATSVTDGSGEVEKPDDVFSFDNAINYLNDNNVWDKTEMEKYPSLQGLFDDMNSFNLEELIYNWCNLNNCIKINKIIEVARKNKVKEWNPKQGEHAPTYNKDGDPLINVTNYINWLDQDQSIPRLTKSKAKKKTAERGKKDASSQGKTVEASDKKTETRGSNGGLNN